MKSVLVVLIALLTAMPTAFSEGEKSQEPLTVGKGKAKFNGLLQAWAVQDSTSSPVRFNFRMRRAELKLSGSVAENTRWFFMVDPAKSLKTGVVASTNDNKILQDLGIAMNLMPDLELVVGQFKIPAMAEGLDSSSELLFPERALGVRTFGDRREPGAMLSYKWKELKVSSMISNGQSPNVDDITNRKDLHFRAEYPVLESLKAGAFTTLGDYSYGNRGRWGANLRYNENGVLVRLEGVRANDPGTNSNAWTADAAYTLTEKFQPALRYDTMKTGGVTGTAYLLGLNYFLAGHASKVQASFASLKNLSGGYGSPSVLDATKGWVGVLAFQAAI